MKLMLDLVKKDFIRNKVMTIALGVFLTLSALLMAGGTRIMGTMNSSLSALNEVALPPDYLQMHKGTFDESAFWEFVQEHDYIEEAIIVEMLVMNNSFIYYNDLTLENSLMDNGLIVQNEKFDFLLGMDNEIASVNKGEIGVPVYYFETLGIDVGDTLVFKNGTYETELVVSTLIRDAQMNAALASSKRFLVHPDDFNEISQEMGSFEYEFEFLLNGKDAYSMLEHDYLNANLPSNGVAITKNLLGMINNLSYGLIGYLIIAVSILLILISLLCLSYIIKATLAEEQRTLGELKAIGVTKKAIMRLYQIKYIVLVLIASFVGYFIAIPFGNFFSKSIILYCGVGEKTLGIWLLPIIGLIVLILLVIRRSQRTIKKNLKSSIVELRNATMSKRLEGHYQLPSKGFQFKNLQIALGELKCKWREYVVIFLVFVMSAFLILLPMNMKETIDNPSFISYMGVGVSDIRIDIQYSETLLEQKDQVVDFLSNDDEIEKFEVYQVGYAMYTNLENEIEYIRISNGNEESFPLAYLEGNAPTGASQIGLSYLYASELGLNVGDTLSLTYQDTTSDFYVSGIYQDITYGGKTAKAQIDFLAEDIEVFIIYLNVTDSTSIEDKVSELRNILSGSKVTPVEEFISQTLGGIKNNMGLIVFASIFVALFLSTLITVMVLQLLTAREHSGIAIKKAMGFSNQDIRMQFGIRLVIVQVLAILIGTILANTLGEQVFSMMLSSMGASRITLIISPWKSYLLSPVIQLVFVFITIFFATNVVKRYHIKDQIME